MPQRNAGRRVGQLAALGIVIWMGTASAEPTPNRELVIFDFEGGLQEWAIPDWALTSQDYGGKGLSPSLDFVSHGKGSLQLLVDFSGRRWTGAYLEQLMYVTDWSPFDALSVDVYAPRGAPQGLKGRIILTVGEKWTWTEMNRGLPLTPGEWTTITAGLTAGSLDWKFFPDEAFRKDIRKLGLRIESETQAYQGPVYVDRIRLLDITE